MSLELRLLLLVAISVPGALGQRNGGQAAGSFSEMGGATISSITPGWTSSPTTAPAMISGIVKMDDGSLVPVDVRIQLVCNGVARTVAQTTSVNDFVFQWNAVQPAGPTPGVSSVFTEIGAVSDAGSGRLDTAANGRRQVCDLRAEAGGYSSTEVNLNNSLDSDSPDVGVIFLHRVAQDETNVVSMSTLQAPKDAKKDFDKGTDLLRAGKLPEAESCFENAVAIYPRFAEAWLSLGRIQLATGSSENARDSAQRAKELDDKLVGAWQILGYIASDNREWTTALRYLDEAVRLDPAASPLPWFFSALAHYQLQGFDEAERSIRAEIKLDPQFRIRRAQFLLALILIARQDTEGGAAVLHKYLAASPDPRDVDNAKVILSRLQPLAAK